MKRQNIKLGKDNDNIEPNSLEKNTQMNDAIHYRVDCDFCRKDVIVGDRYTCQNCSVDLCKMCKLEGKHIKDPGC